eukprot:CAMPEP_0197078378 /NCGR_PEP_ID=MMETSP1384-20130603/213091_1 /TAXON_ID=29189 /ORGANISM="Ammonia sp." /LENGTH=457 /DNA_ID=CAMNT_0042517245 /DNA_START=56 /DNA_END=1429 /DNA_ORIENTATION=+
MSSTVKYEKLIDHGDSDSAGSLSQCSERSNTDQLDNKHTNDSKLLSISITDGDGDDELELTKKSKKECEDEGLYFLGVINLSCLSSELQFILLASICFFGFWLCGYIEELMFGKEKFECGWFLATFELLFFCIVTIIGNLWSHIPVLFKIYQHQQQQRSLSSNQSLFNLITASIIKPRAPMRVHMTIGLAMTFARSLTLFSLIYLNYPTQVIFKSMKLLFVLLGSYCCFGHLYSLLEIAGHTLMVFAAILVLLGSYCCFGHLYSLLEIAGHTLMVFAAILFSLGDHETQTRFTFIGVMLVVSSLVFDSIHANFQEFALKKCKSTSSELMIYSNGIAAVLSGIACVATNEIYEVMQFMDRKPYIWTLFLIRSMSIYIGAVAYLALTKRFGAVIASEVTTARKVLTIVSSYYLFPKPFIVKHSIGSIAFCLAILASVYSKRQQNKNNSHALKTVASHKK